MIRRGKSGRAHRVRPTSCQRHGKRVDAFFELHLWEPDKPWFPKAYREYLASLTCPVFMVEKRPEVPKSHALPKEDLLREFGAFAFASTISWMQALAMKAEADIIGLWGVDMSHQSEWEFQRTACQVLIHEARKRGIFVHVPPESDLLLPTPLYGFREHTHIHRKLDKRRDELDGHIKRIEAEMQSMRDQYWFYKGAMDDLVYMMKTWVTDPVALELAYANPPIRQVEQEPPAEPQPDPVEPPQPSSPSTDAQQPEEDLPAPSTAHFGREIEPA